MGKIDYLLDTNIIIDFLGGKLSKDGELFLNPIIDKGPKVSIITKIELLCFNSSDEDNKLLIDFINDSSVSQLTEDIVNTTINIRKNHKIKLPDAIIASTALVEKTSLVTRNISDFIKVNDLNIINPYDL